MKLCRHLLGGLRRKIERFVSHSYRNILRGLAALVEEHIPESRPFNLTSFVEEFAQGLHGYA